jgi:hypothetical protein
MARWQASDKDKAREVLRQGGGVGGQEPAKKEELRRFRTEAAELLELKEKK